MNIQKLEETKARIEKEHTFEEIAELRFMLMEFLQENGHTKLL